MSGRRWALALLLLTSLRLFAAAILPPAPDEAYYWVWGRALAPGYYDHPPMVALWIAMGTLLAGDTAFGLRLLAPLGVAAASIFLALAGNAVHPQRQAGYWAAALLNATLLFGAGSVLMTPDTPLLVLWCAALWALFRLHLSGNGNWWFGFGILAGLALVSKYTAAFLGIGVVAWLLFDPAARRWWLEWRLWAGGALALLTFSPVIYWNAVHAWASFAKQGGRAGATASGTSLRYLGELVGGQIGLATPVVFVLCVAGTMGAYRAWRRDGDSLSGLLVAMTLPATLVFLWQATGSRVQGNWPAILYPAACLAAALFLSSRWDKWRWPAIGLGLALTMLALVQAAWSPLPLSRRSDPTLARMAGWSEMAQLLEARRRQDGAAFIAAEEYGLASELALHLPAGTPVVAIGDRWDLFDLPRPAEGEKGLLVRSLRRGDGQPLWPAATETGAIVRSRKGIEAEAYRLYEVEVTAGGPPLARLPARR